jgi:thiol-disulfide isomerase/thioredoxin
MKPSIRLISVSLAAIMVLFSAGAMHVCAQSQKASAGGQQMLVGKITQDELYKECPVFAEHGNMYAPDPLVIDKIKAIREKIDILLFVGTWCPDSQKEAPKILKILKMADNPNFSIAIYGVDRAKKDGQGLTETHAVERVPTTIFFKDGKELGRIVEYPEMSPEEDFLRIVGTW